MLSRLDPPSVSPAQRLHVPSAHVRKDVGVRATVCAIATLGVLTWVDTAYAQVSAVQVQETANFDVTVTVDASSAPTFQVFTLPGAPHQFVLELPGQTLAGVPLHQTGTGLLLVDAHIEVAKKSAPARVVFSFADDVDYDALTQGDRLVVKFAHAGDVRVLLASAEKRKQQQEDRRAGELVAQSRADEEARARVERDTQQRALALQRAELQQATRVAALEAKRDAEAQAQALVQQRRIDDERARLDAIGARKLADDTKKQALADKRAAQQQARVVAALAKRAEEEQRHASEEQRRVVEQQARLAALTQERRAKEQAKLQAEAQRRARDEQEAHKRAEVEQLRAQQRQAKLDAEQQRKAAAASERQRVIDDAKQQQLAQAAQELKDAQAQHDARLRAQQQLMIAAQDERARLAALRETQLREDNARVAQAQAERIERAHDLQAQLAAQKREAEERMQAARELARQQQLQRDDAARANFAELRATAEPQRLTPSAAGPTATPTQALSPATRDFGFGGGSIDLLPSTHYTRYIPPPDNSDAFGGGGFADEDSDDEIDESEGRSVLSQVTVQRVGDASRVGVRVDGGARYNITRRQSELVLTLFDTRAANLDVRRGLDAHTLGTNVQRVLPTVEEDARFRVDLIIELRQKGPVRVQQQDGMLWLTVN